MVDAMTAATTTTGNPSFGTVERRGGVRRGPSGIITHFSHEELKTYSAISDGNVLRRHGVWPHDNRSSPGLVSVSFSFRLRVAVAVQFDHRNGGLSEGAWAGGDVARCGTHPLGIFPAKTVEEKDLKDC